MVGKKRKFLQVLLYFIPWRPCLPKQPGFSIETEYTLGQPGYAKPRFSVASLRANASPIGSVNVQKASL